RISDRLANDGYAFANVNAVPDINKEARTVSFNFFVDPGRRTYVRRVNFAGNVATHDDVLRRELRQLEGTWYSAEKIQRSRERLQRLGFFEDVNVETPAVPGAPDQVDVNFAVKERSTGTLMLGIGYSDVGIGVNASVSEVRLSLGWSSDSLDSLIFPTKGTIQRIGGEASIPGSDIEYYKLNYLLGQYWPLSASTSFRTRAEFGYGNGYGETATLPFFK